MSAWSVIITIPQVIGLLFGFWVAYRTLKSTVLMIAGACRDAAELRHQRRLELASASRQRQAGDDLYLKILALSALLAEAGGDAGVLPAAVVPSPPGARRRGRPGPCEHERIIPVITDDGDHVAWICANAPRCEVEFPPSIAVYRPGGAR